jgi:hypothetical protein
MKTFSRLILLICLGAASARAEDPQIKAARQHLLQHPVYEAAPRAGNSFADEIDNLLEGRDAETKTMSFIHGIRRHADRLLSPRQTEQWDALIVDRQDDIKRLHDERNVLRGFFFAQAWEMPLVEAAERKTAINQLRGWLAVWLEITLHERIVHQRLCRNAWQILTADQRARLSRGDWDQYVRKSIGHQRAYFGAKIVTRALGKPTHSAQFQKLSDALAENHVDIQRNLLAAERRWRILTLTQPSVSDALLAAEWNRTAAALGGFFLNQAGHIVRLTRAGYDLSDPETRKRIAAQPRIALADLDALIGKKLTSGGIFHAKLMAAANPAPVKPIRCEGDYRHHLQGVCIDKTDNIYWSYTTTLVKTDSAGKRLRKIEVPSHHGDLCAVSNRIYVAVNLGPFNHPDGQADSWVYVYDLELKLLAKHPVPQVIYGAGGMDHRAGAFFVIGGLPASHEQNYVYEYDSKFQFVKRHEIKSGQTRLGIQTAALIGDHWWFGCYGTPRVTLKTDANFNLLGNFTFDCAYGIAGNRDGEIFIATDVVKNKRHVGTLHQAVPDQSAGLLPANP